MDRKGQQKGECADKGRLLGGGKQGRVERTAPNRSFTSQDAVTMIINTYTNVHVRFILTPVDFSNAL